LIVTSATALPFSVEVVDRSATAVDFISVSYAGPASFHITVAVARQQGFVRAQNPDLKLIVTRTSLI
jgi:hypothetical protein